MDIKDLQNKIRRFTKRHRLDSPLESRILDLMSELGEVSKEILITTDYGNKASKKNDKIEGELGDLFYSLITVANKLNIDLEKVLNLTLKKYEERLKKGSAGSEVDKK